MAEATLEALRKKVRRLTRSPSPQQISNDDIDEYVNTFIQYDFPQDLRLFSFRKTLTFYTDPNIAVYETNSVSGDPLEDFKDKYTGVYNPVYVAGYSTWLSQSESEFYSRYPLINNFSTESTGDGITTLFTGTISTAPLLRNHVLLSSVIASGAGIKVYDDGEGTFDGDGAGTIDYVTGDFSVTFSTAPASGSNVDSTTVPYAAARPDSILYFDNKFTVRPVPDKVYPIQIEVDMRPISLGNDPTAAPALEQWWQYIAYGAAKKVFEDRTDFESIQQMMPEFETQRLMVLRRTNAIQSKERSRTIYNDGTYIGYGAYWPYSEGDR